MAVAVAAAAAACGSNMDFSCSMNVAVNSGAPAAVSCLAAGASTPGIGNAVTISMNGSSPGIQGAQFAMTLPSPPSVRTYGAADVSNAFGQVQTSTGAMYSQSSVGSLGSFSVTLTGVNAAPTNGGTAYFLHGTATVTLAAQSPATGTATIAATF
jgi:hypothetical protein